jgi:hypothetical protein
MLAVPGDTAMEDTVFAVTVSAAVAVIPSIDAVTVVAPGATPVTSPLTLIVAMDGLAALHVTPLVSVAVEPSL